MVQPASSRAGTWAEGSRPSARLLACWQPAISRTKQPATGDRPAGM